MNENTSNWFHSEKDEKEKETFLNKEHSISKDSFRIQETFCVMAKSAWACGSHTPHISLILLFFTKDDNF